MKMAAFKFMLLGLMTVASVFGQTFDNEDEQLDALLNDVFGSVESQDKWCPRIKRNLGGCHECYPCNHSTINWFMSTSKPIQQISLYNSKCSETPMCCVSQDILVVNRIGESCGLRVETGRHKDSPRSVNQGEYPWTAFVYQSKSGKHKLLCAAAFINENSKALVALASCLRGKPSSELRVAFHFPPRIDHLAPVQNVIVHDKFKPEKKQNDIAIIQLRSIDDTPMFAKPVCLPNGAPHPGMICGTVAENHYLIKNHIPKKKLCLDGTGGRMHISQICGVAAGGDHEPRFGAPLFCESKEERLTTYYLYGLAQSTNNEISVSTYTNISNYLDWIDNKIGL